MTKCFSKLFDQGHRLTSRGQRRIFKVTDHRRHGSACKFRGVTTMLGLGIRKFLPGNSTCGAAPAAQQVPPLGGDAASAEERPFIQRKGLGCKGDAAPKAEIPLLQRKGRATLGNKALCRLLTEDVVPPPERRHCAAPRKEDMPPLLGNISCPLSGRWLRPCL